jgi:hypothetical protein
LPPLCMVVGERARPRGLGCSRTLLMQYGYGVSGRGQGGGLEEAAKERRSKREWEGRRRRTGRRARSGGSRRTTTLGKRISTTLDEYANREYFSVICKYSLLHRVLHRVASARGLLCLGCLSRMTFARVLSPSLPPVTPLSLPPSVSPPLSRVWVRASAWVWVWVWVWEWLGL